MVVKINAGEMRRLLESEGVMGGLERVGEQVAQRAASAAPKDTGAGAASIHAERVGAEVRVGWTPEAFYMLFSEIGTSVMAARPFLRPAADGKYDV
jgi:HK97 gp10 family phage protein